MSLKINTNISALDSHKNLKATDSSLSKSLERLSSGLRINRAADDAAGMYIADQLKAQAMGLGQAVLNANDGISIVQIADSALQESINIVNTIKTKSIQAAQDGQTLESRKAIQADIDKLLEELNTIAETTSFNGQKLLSGFFVDKKFQIGAYAGERVNISIGSTQSTKIGHVISGKLNVEQAEGGKVQLTIYSNVRNQSFDLSDIDLKYNNSFENGIGALAAEINKLSDSLGITASAVVSTTTSSNIKSGSTGNDFQINGITIGQVSVETNDSTGALRSAINQKTDQHGVVASVDANGRLILTSKDGRGIKVDGYTADTLGASDISTFGYIRFNQMSAADIVFYDRAFGKAVDFTTKFSADANLRITTSIDSTMTTSSTLQSGSILNVGTKIGFDLYASGTSRAGVNGDIKTSAVSYLKAGSILESGTIIAKNSVWGGLAGIAADVTTDTDSASLITAGSTLASSTVIKAGTQVTMDLNTNAGVITAGNVLQNDVTLNAAHTMTDDMLLMGGSVIQSGSDLAAGSYVGKDVTIESVDNSSHLAMVLTQDMQLIAGSTIEDGNRSLKIAAGSTIGGKFTLSSDAITSTGFETRIAAGSVLASGAIFAAGSTLGGITQNNTDVTANRDVTLKAGSILKSNTVIEAGTRLMNDFVTTTGVIQAGTITERDFTLKGDQGIAHDQTLKKGSIVEANSTFAANDDILTGTFMTDKETNRLSDLRVTSQDEAQIAISVADAALKDLDKVRSDLGSVQNQLTSTIANLNTTKVNVYSAESTIRDVDFAEESSTFTKMQVLSQSGIFALAQANTNSQNVMRLLQ